MATEWLKWPAAKGAAEPGDSPLDGSQDRTFLPAASARGVAGINTSCQQHCVLWLLQGFSLLCWRAEGRRSRRGPAGRHASAPMGMRPVRANTATAPETPPVGTAGALSSLAPLCRLGVDISPDHVSRQEWAILSLFLLRLAKPQIP